MRGLLHGARRIASFASVSAVGALSPLIALPALTAVLGAQGWASQAVGQSAGLFGVLLLNWGWSVEGPRLAAGSAPEDRGGLYAASVRSRLLTALPAMAVVAAITAVAAPTDKPSAALMAVATCLSGALPSWYFIGVQRPLQLALFDGVPRLTAAVVTALALPLVRSAWTYPVVLLVCTGAAVIVSGVLVTRRLIHLPGRADLGVLRERRLLVLSGLVSSGYTTLAIPLVALVAPLAVAVFAAALRFQGFGLLALSAVTNASQGVVSAHGSTPEELQRRRWQAFAANAVLGVVAGTALVLLLPWASAVLLSGTVRLEGVNALLIGGSVVMLAISLSTTFHLLVPAGRTRLVAISGFITSGVGVPLLLVLTALAGATGALLAVLLAETLSAGITLTAALRTQTGSRAQAAAAGASP